MTRFICSNAVGLYVCDSSGAVEGIARIPDAFAGTYFGITWTPDGSELILGHDPGQPDVNDVDPSLLLKRESGRLSIGNRYIPVPLTAPHGMTCIPDGRILIANTGRNALTVVDPIGSFRHHWFDGYEWDRYSNDGEEGSHFNTVFWHEGLIYLLAHNHRRGSYVLILDDTTFDIKRKIESSFRGCHNIWVKGEDILTLSSFTGELRSMMSGEAVWSSGDATSMVRGIAVGKDHILIGDSDRASRADRNFAGGGVYIVERATMKTVNFIDLGNNGGVCEVRLLDEADECHNLTPFSGQLPIDVSFTRKKLKSRPETKLMRFGHRLDPMLWALHEGALSNEMGDITIEADHFGLATLKQNCVDGTIDAEIMFEPTPTIQQIGIVSRHNGPRDLRLYVVFMEYYDRYVMLKWLLNDGEIWRTLLAKYVGSNLRYRLRYEFAGTRHRVWLDDELQMDLEDDTLAVGHPGLRMRGGRVRNLKVTALA